MICHRVCNVGGQGSRVTYAGGASITDGLKTQGVKALVSPAESRYSVTALDPGANDVFTQGLVRRPRSMALRANNPAVTMTAGFEVLVHDVMAAITTAPDSRVKRVPSCRLMSAG